VFVELSDLVDFDATVTIEFVLRWFLRIHLLLLEGAHHLRMSTRLSYELLICARMKVHSLSDKTFII